MPGQFGYIPYELSHRYCQVCTWHVRIAVPRGSVGLYRHNDVPPVGLCYNCALRKLPAEMRRRMRRRWAWVWRRATLEPLPGALFGFDSVDY